MEMRSIMAIVEGEPAPAVCTQIFQEAHLSPLNELQGVKGHAAADLRSKNDVLMYLKQKGFKIVGSGTFGIVCDHPSFGGRYVLKIFSDSAYESFIDYCVKNAGNPHLPKVFGKMIRMKTNACMVRIEVLSPMSDADWNALFIPGLCRKAEQVARGELSPKIGMGMATHLDQESLFTTLVDVIRHKPPGAGLDLTSHAGNCMMRGNTIVVTDPFKSKDAPFGFPKKKNPNAERLAKLRGF